jgi:hypothetical protein
MVVGIENELITTIMRYGTTKTRVYVNNCLEWIMS